MNRQLHKFVVKASWDNEAVVWVATSEDVPGLATEAATAEELHNKLLTLIPELLDANGMLSNNCPEIPFQLLTKRDATAHFTDT